MLKPSIFNAINFSEDFSRESNFFDNSLQRKQNIMSNPSANCFLAFEFKPDSMPEDEIVSSMYLFYGSTSTKILSSYIIELTDRYIFFFQFQHPSPGNGEVYYRLMIEGYSDILYSEKCNYVNNSELTENNICEIIGYNKDFTHGYTNTNYPSCGFFEFSELNFRVFANYRIEYNYTYGRKKTVRSESYIKTRLSFLNLSMYQQNLLKTLCNCDNLKINGVSFYLVSDFTEKNKDEENEICDLQADFIEVDQSFFAKGSSIAPSKIKPTNLFMK